MTFMLASQNSATSSMRSWSSPPPPLEHTRTWVLGSYLIREYSKQFSFPSSKKRNQQHTRTFSTCDYLSIEQLCGDLEGIISTEESKRIFSNAMLTPTAPGAIDICKKIQLRKGTIA